MLKAAVLVAFSVAATAPAFAGENPSMKLAMHLVASYDSLDCSDLMPPVCDSIDVDLSLAELQVAGGYGYVAFLAYDVVGITAVEFSLAGWPTGRGAPRLDGPHWCPAGATTFGNHMGEGGATGFGSCAEAEANGMVLLAYASFGPLTSEDLPIFLEYAPSTFTVPLEPQIAVTDCTNDLVVDHAIFTTGCTIGGTQPDGRWCPGGESMAGEGEGGGLVWAVRIESADAKSLRDEVLGEDLYLLPGKKFPLPAAAEVMVNQFADDQGTSVRGNRFPLAFLRILVKGEPTWVPSPDPVRGMIDYETYVGFLPVNPDGTLPEGGIDWWSWEQGRTVEAERWVRPSFDWSSPMAFGAISFSSGRLDFRHADGGASTHSLPFDEGYVAAFDAASRRLAIAGYDRAAGAWHLAILGEKGQVVLEDPWETAPTTHLHPCDDGRAIIFAVWEDKATSIARPHEHPIPYDLRRGPTEPREHPRLGAYKFSLRTGRTSKLPNIRLPQFPPGERPDPSQMYSLDGRYRVKIKPKGRHFSVAYYDVHDPASPVLLWEKWEGWSLQRSAVSPGGDYVAEILSVTEYPEGPDGPGRDDWRKTLRLRSRSGEELGSYMVPADQMPLGPVVFDGPYLLVGFDGTRASPGYVYIHDMRVPWNLGKGGIARD